jgi:hypothetical protein
MYYRNRHIQGSASKEELHLDTNMEFPLCVMVITWRGMEPLT